ncbi:DUF305 domain-containing protein [Xylanimonas oleitrophica]|uniref:DUF305 domain-containing protein n=1 Tax=Xylanimonas oleitrophica TaxID=2607479 RepID=A0A2W5WL26_9MICO|nr:DUF305 domain-containing protein [Xylanimonas oleitrophica]PZR51967.1 DUF305 domain-containing protein [Xylanimonas oleitrophica]
MSEAVTARRYPALVVVLVAVAALALGALGGLVAGTSIRTPQVAEEGSVEAGFSRDMQAHHAQAVELAVLVRDRSTDEEVRTVALDMLLTQQNQIGQMASWLRTWGLPAAGVAPPMAWMSEGGHGHGEDADAGFAAMPGWVSREDMARLADADGDVADRIFLELMIAHHEGGVEMARDAAERARVEQVTALANGIVVTQEQETAMLRSMLEARGGPVDPAG